MRNTFIRPGVVGPTIPSVVYHINDLKLPGPPTVLLGRVGGLKVKRGVVDEYGMYNRRNIVEGFGVGDNMQKEIAANEKEIELNDEILNELVRENVEFPDVPNTEYGSDVEFPDVPNTEYGSDIEFPDVPNAEYGSDVEFPDVPNTEYGSDVEFPDVPNTEYGSDVEFPDVPSNGPSSVSLNASDYFGAIADRRSSLMSLGSYKGYPKLSPTDSAMSIDDYKGYPKLSPQDLDNLYYPSTPEDYKKLRVKPSPIYTNLPRPVSYDYQGQNSASTGRTTPSVSNSVGNSVGSKASMRRASMRSASMRSASMRSASSGKSTGTSKYSPGIYTVPEIGKRKRTDILPQLNVKKQKTRPSLSVNTTLNESVSKKIAAEKKLKRNANAKNMEDKKEFRPFRKVNPPKIINDYLEELKKKKK